MGGEARVENVCSIVFIQSLKPRFYELKTRPKNLSMAPFLKCGHS